MWCGVCVHRLCASLLSRFGWVLGSLAGKRSLLYETQSKLWPGSGSSRANFFTSFSQRARLCSTADGHSTRWQIKRSNQQMPSDESRCRRRGKCSVLAALASASDKSCTIYDAAA